MAYIVLFTFVLLFTGVAQIYLSGNNGVNNRVISHFFLLSAFIFLFIFASIRKDVGIDYIQYSRLQIPLVISGDYGSVEFLYHYLIKIGYAIGGNQMVFVLTHLVILFFLYQAFKDNSNNFIFSMYVFIFSGIFNHSLNIMRQSIAAAIFLYALKFIFDRNLFKYLFFIFLAFLFHKTAIIYVPLYFIYGIKFDLKRSISVLFLATIISPFISNLLFYISSKYSIYQNYLNKYFVPEELSGTYTIVNIIIMMIFIICYLINNKSLNKKSSFYAYVQILTLCILVFHSFIPNYDRIMIMFLSCQIFSVPEVLKSVKNKQLRFSLIIVVCITYLFLFYRIYILQNIGMTFPYKSIL